MDNFESQILEQEDRATIVHLKEEIGCLSSGFQTTPDGGMAMTLDDARALQDAFRKLAELLEKLALRIEIED